MGIGPYFRTDEALVPHGGGQVARGGNTGSASRRVVRMCMQQKCAPRAQKQMRFQPSPQARGINSDRAAERDNRGDMNTSHRNRKRRNRKNNET